MVIKAVVQSEKRLIRQRMLRLRDESSSREQRAKSVAIGQNLFGIERFKQAATVMFYLSHRSEVYTPLMIKRAMREGKRVGVPVVDNDQLLICEVHDLKHELHRGSFGILEPKPQFMRPMQLSQIEVVILPGLAFDGLGYRLGYGGGYYDKLLKADCRQLLIGLAYASQVVPEIPRLPHDVKVDLLVTEQQVIHCTD